jgi:hypothetical protein
MFIQQAIFTSARSGRHAGYRLVADSGAIDSADRRELTVWGPSHDSLLADHADASSVNFHPLPSGANCVSKTVCAGAEYSARGGQQIYTQCLVVPADALSRFGNNPFALLTAARAQGAVRVLSPIPERLEPIQLLGRASPVDRRLLEKIERSQGADWLPAAVQLALAAESIALVGPVPAETVLAAMLNCLPPRWRTACSFTTGLKYSASRGFRIFVAPEDVVDRRQTLRQTEATLLDSGNPPPLESSPGSGWPRFVHQAISSGRLGVLTEKIAEADSADTIEELHALGRQFLGELQSPDPSETAAVSTDARSHPDPPCAASSDAALSAFAGGATALAAPPAATSAAHRDAYPRLAVNTSQQPAQWLGVADPAALETLERLDDAVFDAITGEDYSLAEIAGLWKQVRRDVGKSLWEESREKYVQHALRVWNRSVEGDAVHDAAAAVRAVEIISTFFGP